MDKKDKSVTYIHEEEVHNSDAPNEIVPVLINLFHPRRILDVGCGIGTFLACFKSAGVDVLGMDGPWVNKELLYRNISEDEFIEQDLSKPFHLDTKFDLVLSLEVAEHIEPASADVFVQNLVSAGKVIVFSAAVPGQGGQNHVNEQWLLYWKEKFLQHDFVVHDVLKQYFWNNPHIFFWYKQNMVVVAHKDHVFQNPMHYNALEDVVHKEMFAFRLDQISKELEATRSGKLPFTTYAKYLLKSVFSKK